LETRRIRQISRLGKGEVGHRETLRFQIRQNYQVPRAVGRLLIVRCCFWGVLGI